MTAWLQTVLVKCTSTWQRKVFLFSHYAWHHWSTDHNILNRIKSKSATIAIVQLPIIQIHERPLLASTWQRKVFLFSHYAWHHWPTDHNILNRIKSKSATIAIVQLPIIQIPERPLLTSTWQRKVFLFSHYAWHHWPTDHNIINRIKSKSATIAIVQLPIIQNPERPHNSHQLRTECTQL
ncbi:hypothetical protein AMTRI_Chr04g183500 [Amborella trichopoda]